MAKSVVTSSKFQCGSAFVQGFRWHVGSQSHPWLRALALAVMFYRTSHSVQTLAVTVPDQLLTSPGSAAHARWPVIAVCRPAAPRRHSVNILYRPGSLSLYHCRL